MTKFLLSALFLAALTSFGDVVLTPRHVEVVVAQDAPKTTVFAAEELTNFLAQVLGAEVPIRTKKAGGESRWTKDGVVSIVLGDNEASRAAGIDVKTLARDGFVIKAVRGAPSCVYIAGVDSNADLRKGIATRADYNHVCDNEHATLFGVYEFLERFAGCRFYFIGKYGTIVPKATSLRVPETDIKLEPYFTARDPYMQGDGAYFDEDPKLAKHSPSKCLMRLRMKMETEHIPCCHGQREFQIPARFFKEHPEYSQLQKDGRRNSEVQHKHDWQRDQLCQTSGIWEEIYKDVASYFKGEGPEVRKMVSKWDRRKYDWNWGFKYRKYVDCMPQDDFHECFCEKCQAAYDHSTKHYANDLIWGQMAKLGNRLKAEGISGTITQMSYPPYGEVPTFDLPDNILVMVAQSGPWRWRPEARAKQVDMFRRWAEKTHRRVLTWTYPHKYGPTRISGIPCLAPHIYGIYWKEIAPYVTGGFLESEAENSIYQYLNYYVFSKIAWDKDVDVEAVIADHHAKMFGKGAAAMTRVYDLFEEKWLKEIAGNVVMGALGPVSRVPPVYEIWTRVYSPEILAQLAGWFDEAEKATDNDAESLARVKYMRSHLLDPLRAEAKKYLDTVSVEAGRKAHAAPSRSVVSGGSLDSLDGWQPECEGTKIEIDREVKVEGSGSLKIVCDKPGRHAAIKYLNGVFKPNTEYKISFFMKLDNIVLPKGKGGVYVEISDGEDWLFAPKVSMIGTVDWVYVEGIVRTLPEIRRPEKQLLHLLALDATGTVWFDDVRVEEVTDGANAAGISRTSKNTSEEALAPFPKWGEPERITSGPHEHFLASYFAINSWSPNKRYMLVLETDLNGRLPEAGERCAIGLVDRQDGNRFIPITTTACWNFQEAAMGHWLSDDEFLFNDVRDGRFKTVILNWKTKRERVLPLPVSAVSEDRTWAVSVNYARLYLLRPDYGYAGGGQDARENDPWPKDDGLWTMNLKTGETKLILSVADTRAQMPQPKIVPGKPGQPLAYHCHTVISKDGAKIFFLARSVDWFNKETHEIPYWKTTSFTVDRDGRNLRRCFKDGWAGSHFNWAPDGSHRMLVTASWNPQNDPKIAGRYWSPVEFEVGKEEQVRRIGKGILDEDWHCVYSPDCKFMSGETYWYRYDTRPWVLVRLADGMTMPVGSFYVPEAYRGTYWRCDLHARYREDGREIAFNSVHEGSRQVYVRPIELPAEGRK